MRGEALRTLAREGWVPFAVAMVGTQDKLPMWADQGLRPVIGTSIDIKVAPAPLSVREVNLLCGNMRTYDTISIPYVSTFLPMFWWKRHY